MSSVKCCLYTWSSESEADGCLPFSSAQNGTFVGKHSCDVGRGIFLED